jgi:hypothetical protein
MNRHPGYPPLGPGAGPDATPTPRNEPGEPAAFGAHKLSCPLCSCTTFNEESGSLDSDYGLTAHRVDIRICTHCGYVLLFGKGRSVWWNTD